MLKQATAAVLISIGVFGPALADEPATRPAVVQPAADARPLVQIALLLDTSNSMDGLISQARTQLWKIVNETTKCSRDGQMPRVEVALFEYGNSRLSVGENYVRMVLPFTSSLDDVSEKLFALTTNGGDEYCGSVIQSATNGLRWSDDPKAYKAIFVCGNEPFTQGPIDFRTSIPGATAKGVIVNTIHCGQRAEGMTGQWASGADLGHGKFLNIDQDREVVVLKTPFDERIQSLSVKLNVTYVPYGAGGGAAHQRQSMQDSNAAAQQDSGAAFERALTKAGRGYDNSGWDLIDALERKSVQLVDLPDSELPEALRGKSLQEKQAYLDARKSARADMQKQIAALSLERERFVVDNAKTDAAANTLDAALVDAIHGQLKALSFDVPTR